MGFENRKSLRVNLAAQVYFWVGAEPSGPGVWGQTINLSATGLALHSGQSVSKGEKMLLELSLPDQKRPLHVSAEVISCERVAGAEERHHLRVSFVDLESEDRHLIRLHVLQVAEPGMGWGRAYFPGLQALDSKYRELSAVDRAQWIEKKQYLSMKELVFLKKFQISLEESLGSKIPESLKLAGSRPLKEHADVWIEFDLGHGQLHFLAKTLWCRHEKGEKPELGLSLTAFHKEEAMKIEKAV